MWQSESCQVPGVVFELLHHSECGEDGCLRANRVCPARSAAAFQLVAAHPVTHFSLFKGTNSPSASPSASPSTSAIQISLHLLSGTQHLTPAFFLYPPLSLPSLSGPSFSTFLSLFSASFTPSALSLILPLAVTQWRPRPSGMCYLDA